MIKNSHLGKNLNAHLNNASNEHGLKPCLCLLCVRREEEADENGPSYKDNITATYNVFTSVHYYLDHGVPKDKLVVGMAFYGRGFHLKDPQMNGLYCDADDGIPKGPFSRQIGIWGYDEIIGKMQGKLDIDLPEETGTWTIGTVITIKQLVPTYGAVL